MTHSLHIIGSAELGGAESFYLRLIHGLNARGDRASAMNRPDSKVSTLLSAEIEQQHAAMRNQWDLLSRWQISRYVRQHQPAIVQTYMTRATTTTHIKPDQGTIHIARLGGYYTLKRFAHAHAWVGNTRGICDYLIQGGMPADKVFYIGNFVGDIHVTCAADKASRRQSLGIPEDAFVLVAAGRFTRKKGFDTLLSAYEKLPARINGRPIHLVIVGDGSLKPALHAQAAAQSRATQIHWPGWQTDPAPWFQFADVYICPSREEPLGNVILEAWAHGRPLVSTRTLGGCELVNDGSDGTLVDVDDADAMAFAISTYLRSDSLRAEHSRAGKHRIAHEFSETAIVSQYQALYQQLHR